MSRMSELDALLKQVAELFIEDTKDVREDSNPDVDLVISGIEAFNLEDEVIARVYKIMTGKDYNHTDEA